MAVEMTYDFVSEGRAKKARHLIQSKTASRAEVDGERLLIWVHSRDRRMVSSIVKALGATLVAAEKHAVGDGIGCLEMTAFREAAIQRAAYGEAFKANDDFIKPPDLPAGKGGLPGKAFSKW